MKHAAAKKEPCRTGAFPVVIKPDFESAGWACRIRDAFPGKYRVTYAPAQFGLTRWLIGAKDGAGNVLFTQNREGGLSNLVVKPQGDTAPMLRDLIAAGILADASGSEPIAGDDGVLRAAKIG
jgi:hypothetical protein